MPDDTPPRADALIHDPEGGIAAARRDHGAAARSRARLPLGHRAGLRLDRALHHRGGLRGRRRHRPRATWPRSATSSAICSSRSSTTPAWPRRPAPSPSTTWSRAISDKMIRRHPHVFGDASRDKTADAADRRLGARSRPAERGRGRQRSAGIAAGLPALTRAVKLQNRAARVGFDWPDAGAVLDKIAEETAELVEARDAGDAARVLEEYGDLMFVMANLARHLERRPRGRAARRQRQVHPPLRGDRGRARRPGPHAGPLRPRRDGRPLERRQARGARAPDPMTAATPGGEDLSGAATPAPASPAGDPADRDPDRGHPDDRRAARRPPRQRRAGPGPPRRRSACPRASAPAR